MFAPFMISEQDDELLGVANRSDAMGMLAVWSARARDLVPHLTEQTTNVRGFQILVEAFRLWELYEPEHPEHAGRLDDFFLIVEQTFARTVVAKDAEWPLPGARRAKSRAHEQPFLSIVDFDWHLLGGQKANGIWGLYRGASRRAKLLTEDLSRLSDDTLKAATQSPGFSTKAQTDLFVLAKQAMDGETVALPLNGVLAAEVYQAFHNLPLAVHLYNHLVAGHEINLALSDRLLVLEDVDIRGLITAATAELPQFRGTLADILRCENLLSVVESVFFLLCASKGKTIEAVVAELPVDLDALERARQEFSDSGFYHGDTAQIRSQRFHQLLQTSSKTALVESVLELHRKVSEERGRAAWVWVENGTLQSDVDIPRPSDLELQVGAAWRNDYYLNSLRSISRQLAEALHG